MKMKQKNSSLKPIRQEILKEQQKQDAVQVYRLVQNPKLNKYGMYLDEELKLRSIDNV